MRTLSTIIALLLLGNSVSAALVVRGTVHGGEGSSRLVWRMVLPIDAQGKPIPPTKEQVYDASQRLPKEKVEADGKFEMLVRPGQQLFFACADLNANGRWDPEGAEPMGWYATEAAGGMAAVDVAEEDIEDIDIELKAPTPFAREEQVAEGGSLRWIKGYPVLHLKGDAQARGYAHGKLAAAQIVDFFRFYVLEEKTKSAKAYEEGFAKFLQTNFAWPKEMVVECEAVIEGMQASGADLRIPELGRDFSLVDLYAINGYIETRAMASHCTQFAAWGDRTTETDVDGGMITGRNMDGEIDIRRVTVSHFLLMAVEPSEPGQKRYVSMMWPGFVATISGINEEGFYTMENAGLTGPGPVVDKLVPFSWTMRQALVTQGADATPSGVQSLIDSFDNSAGGSCGPGCITLFATPYNGQRDPAWVHEGDRFGDASRLAGEAEPRIPQVLVASNHPRKYGVDPLRPDWVFDVRPSYSSLWRYQAGMAKLAAWHRVERKIGTPEMQQLLQTVAHGTTEYSVVTRPNAGEFDVAVASLKAELWDAPYRAWTTFKFDEVFGSGATSTAAK